MKIFLAIINHEGVVGEKREIEDIEVINDLDDLDVITHHVEDTTLDAHDYLSQRLLDGRIKGLLITVER